MPKSQQPRGHFWSHASEYQRSAQYQTLSFEDIAVDKAEILCYDSDGQSSPTTRAAKKRRVEKIARDFVDGQPIFLSCVRPGLASFKNTINWHKNSSGEPGFKNRHLFDLRARDLDSKLVDKEDEQQSTWKSAKKKRQRRESDRKPRKKGTKSIVEQTSCRLARGKEKNSRTPKIATIQQVEDTSDLSMTVRSLNFESATPTGVDSVIPYNTLQNDTYTVQEIFASSKDFSNTKDKQASRQASSHDGDSLQCENTEGVHDRRSSRQSTTSNQEIDAHLHKHNTVNSGEGSSNTSDIGLSRERCRASKSHPRTVADDSNFNTGHAASYHTEPETSSASLPAIIETSQAGESQSFLSKYRDVKAPLRRSWTALNETTNQKSNPIEAPAFIEDQSNALIRKSILQSVEQSAGQHRSSSRRTSARLNKDQQEASGPNISGLPFAQTEPQRAVDPDLPVDMQCRMSGFRPMYTSAPVTQSGTTPLQYRVKHIPPGHAGDQKPASGRGKPRRQRRRMDFSTPTSALAPGKERSREVKLVVAPQLEMSFGEVSSFAPNLDEVGLSGDTIVRQPPHTTQDIQSTDRTSDATMGQLVAAKTQYSPAIGGSPSRARLQKSRDEEATDDSTPSRRQSESTSKAWPGTQAALFQAEAGFFHSPAKSPGDDSSNTTPASESSAKPGNVPSKSPRSPHAPSQEPLLSTQQMLDDFPGWSTVRKPRTNLNPCNSHVSTPTQLGKRMASRGRKEQSQNTNESASRKRESAEGESGSTNHLISHLSCSRQSEARRKSRSITAGSAMAVNLFPEMASTDPGPRAAVDSFPEDQVHFGRSSDKSSFALHRAMDDAVTSNEDETTWIYSTSALVPSHQAAQEVKDVSDISQAVSELARDVLYVSGIDGTVDT